MKLFASDYDGTYFKHINRKKGEVETNFQRVAEWQKKGNLFIFATGRSISMMVFEKKRRRIKYDYIVGLNGGIIVDKNDNVLFREAIKSETAREIINLLDRENVSTYCITDGIKGHVKTTMKWESRYLISLKLMGLFTRTYHLSKKQALALPVAQIALTCKTHDEAEAFAAMINERFSGEVSAFANLIHVDIQAPGLSKASGMEFVARKYGISPENVYGMGDSFNDVPMFEKYNGLTLPEAAETIKEKAGTVYETVGHALKDLI